MLRGKRVSRLFFFVILLLLMTVPVFSTTAFAEEEDLYILIEMDSSFVYDTYEHNYISIKYFTDPTYTTEVAIDHSYETIEFYNVQDLSTPLAGPPKDAGQYRLLITYDEEVSVPQYNASSVYHDFDITKANIGITAAYHEIVYNAGSIPDSPYNYDFDLESQPLLNSEFSENQDQWAFFKSQLFGSTELNREPGIDVGEYNILADYLELQEPYASNYTFSFTSNIFEIIPAELTLNNITILNKTYDATDVAEFTYSGDLILGRKGSDLSTDVNLDISNAQANYIDYTAGNFKNVIFTGYELVGTKADNYFIQASTTYSANISKRVLEIEAQNINREYDPNYLDGDLDYNIDAIGLGVLETEFNTSDLATIKSYFDGVLSRTGTNDAGTYSIEINTLAIPTSGIGNFNLDNYSINYTAGDYIIEAYRVDIVIDEGQSKIYGDADPTITYTISVSTPLYSGHTLIGDLSREAGENAGLYDILIGTLAIDGTLASNYNLNLINYENAFDLVKRQISISAIDKVTIYGEALVPLEYEVTSGGTAYSDIISGEIEKALGTDAGDYAITQGTLTITNIDNYDLTFIEGTYTIEQIVLNILVDTLAELEKSYGEEDPHIAFTVINEEDLLSTHIIGGSLGRESGESAGQYALNTSLIIITDESENDVTSNYNLQLDPESYIFLIYRDEIFINFNILASSPYDGNPKDANPVFYDDAEESTLVSISITKYEIYYYLRGESVPLLYTPVVPGLYTVAIDFIGTDNYMPKVESFDYEIEKAMLEVVGISIADKNYDTTNIANISGIASLDGDIYDLSKVSLDTSNVTATFNNKNVNIVEGVIQDRIVTVDGYALTGEHADYYEIVQPLTFNSKIMPAVLKISAQEIIREYNPFIQPKINFNIDSALSILEYDFGTTSLLTIKSYFVGSLYKMAGSSVGTYAITRGTLDLPEAVSDNYVIEFTGANYIITPINFNVYVTQNQSKVYGDADPAEFTYTYEEEKLLPGDTIDGVLAREMGNNVGSYEITQGTLTVIDGQNNDVGDSGLGNYTITLVTSPFIIEKRPISIKANNVSITFGEPVGELADYISQGSLAYDDVLTGNISRVAGNYAGTYSIVQGTRSISNAENYDITFIEGTYTINPRLVNLSVDPNATLNKVYGEEDPEIAFILSSSSTLIAGHTIGGSLGRSIGENAGKYSLNTDGIIVLDEEENDVTYNYSFWLNVAKEPTGIYEFIIEKRTLLIKPIDIEVEKDRGYMVQVDYKGFIWGQTVDDLDVNIIISVSTPLEEGTNIVTLSSEPKEGSTANQDKNYNIVLQTGTITLIDPDNIPVVEEIDTESETFKEKKNAFIGFTHYSGKMLLDVDTQSGYEPNRRVGVTVELPDDLAGKKLSVLYISDAGEQVVTSEMNEDGNVLFFMEDTGRGQYLIAKTTSGFVIIILPILAGLLVIGGVGFMVLKKLKQKKNDKEDISDNTEDQEDINDEVLGLKRDFSSEEFGSIIDTGNKSKTDIKDGSIIDEEKKSKRGKKKGKKAQIELIDDNIELDTEDKEISMDDIIDTSSSTIFGAKSSVDTDIDEDDYLSIISKTSNDMPVENESQDDNTLSVSDDDFSDLIDPKSNESEKADWEDYDDDMDDLIPPAYQNKYKEQSNNTTKKTDDSFESLDLDDDYDDLLPLAQQKKTSDKIVLSKVEPKKTSSKKIKEDVKTTKDMSDLGEFSEADKIEKTTNDKSKADNNDKKNGSKIVKQGGMRRFDD